MVTRGCAPSLPVPAKVCLLQIPLITFVWPDAGSAIASFISADLSVLARSWRTFPEWCLVDAARKCPFGSRQARLGLRSDGVVLSSGSLTSACRFCSLGAAPCLHDWVVPVCVPEQREAEAGASRICSTKGWWWPCIGGQLGLGAGGVKKCMGEDKTPLLGFKPLMEAFLMAPQPIAVQILLQATLQRV